METSPHLLKRQSERVLKKGNAFIVLGVDRPGGPGSGFGGLGKYSLRGY